MRMEAPYEELRPLLFSIAYRMVGSVSEAEDIVQEAFLRIHRAEAEGTKVDSPKAYLSAVVTRLSIDHLKSARRRRAGGDGRLALDGLPRPAGEPDAGRAGGLPAARGLRVRLCRDREDRPAQRGQLPAAVRPCAAPHRRGTAAVRSLTRTARRARAAILRRGTAGRHERAGRTA